MRGDANPVGAEILTPKKTPPACLCRRRMQCAVDGADAAIVVRSQISDGLAIGISLRDLGALASIEPRHAAELGALAALAQSLPRSAACGQSIRRSTELERLRKRSGTERVPNY